jgi:hypothetical protein
LHTRANSENHGTNANLLINADSSCTDILVKKSAAHFLENRKPWTNYGVTVANNATLTSIEKGNLRVPAKSGNLFIPAYVFDNHAISSNLAGLSTLCNKGCTAILTKKPFKKMVRQFGAAPRAPQTDYGTSILPN